MIVKSVQKKNVSKFLIMGFSKELVIIVSNRHFLSRWNHLKKTWDPEGYDFRKLNKFFDHACLGKKWENPWFRNSFSNSSKSGNKNDEFLKEIDNW